MEELFRYYLRNIIILRIGTGLRYLWLRFVRHRKISYRTLYEGSKSKKISELSNFENEMSNRAWGCGFILYGHENEMYKEPMNLKRGKGVYMRELR